MNAAREPAALGAGLQVVQGATPGDAATARRGEIDAIRSVALFGICVVNLPFLAMPLEALLAPAPSAADGIARVVVEIFFQGKFFVLFSFLFGWGFGAQLASAARRGVEAWPRYLARLLGLLLIGAAHAVLVFSGDILMLYALLGFALWGMRAWPVRRLLLVAAGALALAAVCLMGLAVLLGEVAASPVSGPGYLGGFLDATAQRVRDLGLALPIVLLFNGPIALAAFCAGFAAYRVGFFEPGSPAFVRLRRNLPMLALLGIAGNLAYVLAVNGWLGNGLAALFGFGALAVGGPALAAVYLSAIVTAARRGRIPRAFGAVGSMSLSAYVAQGVLAGFIFGGYGLGFYGQLGSALLLLLAAGVFAVVHLLCMLWLRYSALGPLERLLRALAPSARFGMPPR